MNPRRQSLRSHTTPSASLTPKRPLSEETRLSGEKSNANKKTKKRATQPSSNQPLTDEGVALPNYELLSKASELANYYRALLLKQNQTEELLNLDQLLSLSFSKSQNESAKERLEKVLRWKLLRGQFRATLPALVAQNSSEDVDRVVRKALNQLASCHTVDTALQSDALQTMCELKGVGPATAAAFLSFEFPRLIPVFSDEAASFFEKKIGSIKYTVSFYKKFVNLMYLKTQELTRSDDIWHINRLERSLWTLKLLKKHLSNQTWLELMGTHDLT